MKQASARGMGTARKVDGFLLGLIPETVALHLLNIANNIELCPFMISASREGIMTHPIGEGPAGSMTGSGNKEESANHLSFPQVRIHNFARTRRILHKRKCIPRIEAPYSKTSSGGAMQVKCFFLGVMIAQASKASNSAIFTNHYIFAPTFFTRLQLVEKGVSCSPWTFAVCADLVSLLPAERRPS